MFVAVSPLEKTADEYSSLFLFFFIILVAMGECPQNKTEAAGAASEMKQIKLSL